MISISRTTVVSVLAAVTLAVTVAANLSPTPLAKGSPVNTSAGLTSTASEGNLDAFEASPTRYVPRFGGFCAYGVSVGKKFDGDPLVYTLHAGKLYLNLNPEIAATFSKDVPGNVDEGVSQWARIHDKSPADL